MSFCFTALTRVSCSHHQTDRSFTSLSNENMEPWRRRGRQLSQVGASFAHPFPYLSDLQKM